jgi:hypothetical protein
LRHAAYGVWRAACGIDADIPLSGTWDKYSPLVFSRLPVSNICTLSMNMLHNKEEKHSLEAADSEGIGQVINASGHKQELKRQFGLLSICAVGITTGNVWVALGGAIVSCRFLHSIVPPI